MTMLLDIILNATVCQVKARYGKRKGPKYSKLDNKDLHVCILRLEIYLDEQMKDIKIKFHFFIQHNKNFN